MIELRNVCISFDEEILKKTSIKIPEQKITCFIVSAVSVMIMHFRIITEIKI